MHYILVYKIDSASKGEQMSAMAISLARVLLLMLMAMDAAHVSGNITKCASGCGSQDNNDYIDYCDGEDDVVSQMRGEK